MVENSEEKPRENQSGTASLQPKEDASYFPTTSQPQDETAALVEESRKADEDHGGIEDKFTELLKAMNEEISQLTQFLAEERKLTNELCSLLTQILRNLRISFNIPSECLDELDGVKKVKLNKEGHLSIMRKDGKVETKPLEEQSPEVIISVLLTVVPELERAIKAYRRNVSRRVSLLGKIKHELKGLHEAFTPRDNDSTK
jgi:hypothetical protein